MPVQLTSIGVLSLIPALILTAFAIFLLHWCPPLLVRWRLSRPAAYTLGVTTVGFFLTWHQVTVGAEAWHYWVFFLVGGVADVAAYIIDDRMGLRKGKPRAENQESGLSEHLKRYGVFRDAVQAQTEAEVRDD